jgi:[calcium/calmodulin-dependent protein kinase] kinase
MFVAQGDDRTKESGGSPAFLSPESFTSHAGDLHGKAVDIWALGTQAIVRVTELMTQGSRCIAC